MTFSRLRPLDGLRAVAIVFVLLYHAHIPFFTGGFVGVNIFYVLSGFLITSILLREHGTTGRIHLGRFWLRRLLRLYPALLAVVIVAALVWPLVSYYDGSNVDVWTAVILALTYTANIGRWLFHTSMGALSQTWSLAMEEQFYLVWPPVLALILSRFSWFRRRGILIAGLAALAVGSSVLGWLMFAPRGGTATPDVYFSPVLNVGPLLMGCIVAIALRSERVTDALRGRLGIAATAIGAVALAVIEVSIVSGWQEQSAIFGLVLPLAGLATALLIAGAVSRTSVLSRALSLAPIAWVGRNISYSLYLWHVLVFALVLPIVPGTMGKVSALAASVGVAVLSHYLIERPFLRLKRRFEARPAEIEAPAPASRELVAV